MAIDVFSIFSANSTIKFPDVDISSVDVDGRNIRLNPAYMHSENIPAQEFNYSRSISNNLVVALRGRVLDEYDALEWVTWIKNDSDVDSERLSNVLCADVSFSAPKTRSIHHSGINGDSNSGDSYIPFDRQIRIGDDFCISPKGGRSSCKAFPFFDMTDDSGVGVIVAIGWSGQWKYEIKRDIDAIRLHVGLEQAEFFLRPGEEIRMPRVLIKRYSDVVQGHNDFRRLMSEYFSPHIANTNAVTLPAAIQCFDRYAYVNQYWCTEEGQKEYALCAARIGHIDTVWLDAAWFKGKFPYGVGNYSYSEGFPNGLKPVSEQVHKLGMKFMLWFEPERVAAGTQMYTEHPEWVLKVPGAVDTVNATDDMPWSKVNGVLNLAMPDVVDFLTEKISGMIAENGIDIYRQDFNIDPLPFWQSNDEPGRSGMTEIKHVMGLYRFWDKLRERFPNLLIDNCASGGRRIDLETCMRAVPLWRSDTGCSPLSSARPSDLWNQNQSLSLSRYLVYHSVAAWNWGAYEFRSAATNGIAANFDVLNDNFNYTRAGECMLEFDRLRKYWLGDFYPLTAATLDDSIWCAFQFHRRAENDGVLMLFRRANSPYESAKFALNGIDRGAQYMVVFSDENRELREVCLSGDELADGYCFTIRSKRASLVVEYYERGGK